MNILCILGLHSKEVERKVIDRSHVGLPVVVVTSLKCKRCGKLIRVLKSKPK